MESQNLSDLLKQAKKVDYNQLTDEELEKKATDVFFADKPDDELAYEILSEGWKRNNTFVKALVANALYQGSHGLKEDPEWAREVAMETFLKGQTMGAYALAQMYINNGDLYLGGLILELVKDTVPGANDMWTGLQAITQQDFEKEPPDYYAMNGHQLLDALNYFTALAWKEEGEGYWGVAKILSHWPHLRHGEAPSVWYEMGALCENSHPECLYKTACRYATEKRHEEAFDLYMQAYDKGYDKASLQIAYALWFQKGVKREDHEQEARKYFIEATDLERIRAYVVKENFFAGASADEWCKLGHASHDWYSSLDCFKKAAELGSVEGLFYAANYMKNDHPKNFPQALEWYRKVAKGKDSYSEQAKKALEELGEPLNGRYEKPTWRFETGFPLFLSLLLMLLTVLAIVLVRRMDQMSFRSITEEEAMEMAQEIKVTLPDQEVTLLESGESQKLKTGKTVKVLGVYKNKLNKGNSPRVYWTNQNYLMELPDGTRAYGPLMETAIGQLNVFPEGDTAVITAVKLLKKNPVVQKTGEESRFQYAYTIEGHEGQYALEDLHIYFLQRVAYLADGLTPDRYIDGNDTLAENKKDFQKVKKFFLYDIRPITKKTGFFVFPKYQEWNEFYLQRWFRNLMIFLAYVAELLVLFLWIPLLIRNRKWTREPRRLRRAYAKAQKGDADACCELAKGLETGALGRDFNNFGESLKWYKRAAYRGSGEACLRLGKYYENRDNYFEAEKWYMKEALYINPKNSEDLDRIRKKMYAASWNDKGVDYDRKGDLKLAVYWFQTAADAGDKHAQCNLGNYYYDGKGVEKDFCQAFKLYYSSAMQGFAPAQYQLAFCYINGEGVAKDKNEGIKWLKKAARKGDENAINSLKNAGISY